MRNIILLYLAICLLASCQKTDPFDELRMRYYRLLVPETDISDSIVRQRIDQADRYAGMYWESMEKSPGREYLWEDLKRVPYIPGEVPHGSVSSKVTGHFGRLTHLSQVLRTKNSRYYNNPQLKQDILDGFDWVLRNAYNPGVEWYDNWWDWVIGIPMTLNNLLVIMYDDLSDEQVAKAVEALDFFAPNVTYEGASTGANKIWQCKNMALRGIIAKNPEQISMGIKGLDTEFKYVTTHDGFYRDGSFVQHQWHAYTGGYGRSMLRELTDIIVMVQGSEWEVAREHQDMIYEWIHNSFAPVVYRGALMDMVRGREASRPESDRAAGHSLLVSLIRLSAIAPEKEKQFLASFVKENVQADTYREFMQDVPTYLMGYTRQLLSDPGIAPARGRSLTKIFAAMDRAIHIRPGFAFVLSMSSSRIEDYETINGENVKGWYTGDGMTYLYDNDLAQYSDCFWPTVDAYRIPGTTVDTRPREAKSLPFGEGILYADGYKSPRSWVGGSEICDSYGMVGMWYDAQDATLEAKKSWMMVGDGIVALGAGISSSDNRTVETIVDNRKLNEGSSYRFTADGKELLASNGKVVADNCHWLCFEGVTDRSDIGYFFPSATSLNLMREDRTGSWSDINLLSSETPVERSYFTAWIDHGKSPKGAGYAYVILPGRNRETTLRYAQNPDVQIIANTPQVQAAVHRQESVTGINFWEAASLPAVGITVDAPASLIIKETETMLVVGISDPTQQKDFITVSFDRSVNSVQTGNPDIKVLSRSPLKLQVNLRKADGITRSIILNK